MESLTDTLAQQKTGHNFAHWNHVLTSFHGHDKPATELVAYLQAAHQLDHDIARALATKFLKQKLGSWKA